LLAAIFAGLTIITVLFDGPILRFVQSAQDPLTTSLKSLGGVIGHNYCFWCFLLCIYIVTKFAKWKQASGAVYAAMLSAGVTACTCYLAKLIFLRARPETGFGPLSFFNHAAYAVDKGMFLSLPSGDVAIVAGAAVSLSLSLNSRRLLLFLLLVPFMTAFSRVSLNRHWPSDTLIAFAIGMLVAYGLRNSNWSRLGKRIAGKRIARDTTPSGAPIEDRPVQGEISPPQLVQRLLLGQSGAQQPAPF
jgi:membrane-associated phospholipid phosphatase